MNILNKIFLYAARKFSLFYKLNFNKCLLPPDRMFIILCFLAPFIILCFFNFVKCFAAEDDEGKSAFLIKTSAFFYAPLYPQNPRQSESIVIAQPAREYEALKSAGDVFIVNDENGKYAAPVLWFVDSRLAGPSENALKNSDFNVNDFFKIKLPPEIEKSEFFFNNASKKTFYSLAFLLFLKYGPAYKDYKRKLGEYDDFMADLAKNKSIMIVLDALAHFINSFSNSGEGPAAVFINRRPCAAEIYSLLNFRKPVFFLSRFKGASGDIIIAYSYSGKEGFEQSVNCYVYGAGLVTLGREEFERILDDASNCFMALK